MPQLPSVSELLIGAHNPAGSEVRPESQLPRNYRNSVSAQKKLSETSPRQTEAYLNTLLTTDPAGPPAKVARVALLLHTYPGMVQHAIVESHPGIKDSFVVPSTTSSGRNSILSIGSDTHAPLYVNNAVPFSGGQMDYFNYRESHRPRHALLHLLQLLLLLPRLHYRQRRESVASAGVITRATLYQSIPSQDQAPRYESHLPLGGSPTLVARPRPASFSYAPGPLPMGAPGVLNAPPPPPPPHMAPAYHHLAGPAPGHPQAHGQVQAHVPYYNTATAGSGFPPSFPPGTLPVYPGPINTMAYPPQVQLSPGSGPAYGHEYYPHAQLKTGPPPHAQYLQMDANAHLRQAQHQHQHRHDSASSDDMVLLATDPNHALINKRCIIKRRTRTGCLTCRKRRIKCDERKPHCFNCERSKKLCLGYECGTNSNNSSRETSREGSRQNSTEKNEVSEPIPSQPPKERLRSSVHDLM